MERLKFRLRKVENGEFRQSDVWAIADCCNMLIDKVNELVEEVEQLKKGKEYPTCLNQLSPFERGVYLMGRWNLEEEGDNHGKADS